MELNYRTFIRHAVLAAVLIASLFFIQGFQSFSVRELMARNGVFLALWFIACPPLGWLAHRFTAAGLLKRWVAGLFAGPMGRSPFQLYRAHLRAANYQGRKVKRPGNSAGLAGLFFKWSTCSRCVAWWVGGGFSFFTHLVYWPTWPAAVYFAALGASLAAATAVFFYLRTYATKPNAA